MTTFSPTRTLATRQIPRVAVFSFASCFGCQLQITNKEQYLLDVVGQIELVFWSMTSSAKLPEDYDVAIIEGALTTEADVETVRHIREVADTLITIGACANGAGIPGMAARDLSFHTQEVYGESVPSAAGKLVQPRSVRSVVDADFIVPCCPIDFYEFVDVLQQALMGSNKRTPSRSMCGECKANETQCFYERGQVCMGMVTMAGCHARCVNLGRPCSGCRGLSPSANLSSACDIVEGYGLDVDLFCQKLEMFNQTNPQYQEFMESRNQEVK